MRNLRSRYDRGTHQIRKSHPTGITSIRTERNVIMESNASIITTIKNFFRPSQSVAPPKKKTFFEEYGYLGLCMLLPALVMYLMYCARGIHPISDGSVLVLDLNGQYVWFFEALRNFVKGDASLLYSFARAMAVNLWEFTPTIWQVPSPLSCACSPPTACWRVCWFSSC